MQLLLNMPLLWSFSDAAKRVLPQLALEGLQDAHTRSHNKQIGAFHTFAFQIPLPQLFVCQLIECSWALHRVGFAQLAHDEHIWEL